VWSVVYSPKGQILATCSVDYSIRLWDVDTGQCLKVLNHASPVVSVIYSPDGQKWQVMALIKVYEFGTRLQENVSRSFSVIASGISLPRLIGVERSFSPDGQTLASNRETGAIQIWHVATGQPLW